MDDREVDEERAARLTSLVHPHLPITIPTPSLKESWAMLGPALVARMTGTLEAIIQLRPLRRAADEIILTRSLFDHTVTFAWLAGDSGHDRLHRFARTDAVERLKIDNHCRTLGVEALNPEMRDWFETNKAGLDDDMPPIDQRARQADRDWMGNLPGLGEGSPLNCFEGLYAMLYRHHSGYEHPSALGMLSVAEDLPSDETRISLEETADPDALGLTCALYSYGLYIAGQTIGWPDAADVAGVWGDSVGA